MRPVRRDNALGSDRNAEYLCFIVLILLDELLYFVGHLGIVRIGFLVRNRKRFCLDRFSVQVDGDNVKHIFQNTNADRDPGVGNNLEQIGFSASGRFQISVSLNKTLLL